MINRLLNHNISCPGDVTVVNNTYIKEVNSQHIGLCPFELTINYNHTREPAVILEAKCTPGCNRERCSRRSPARCETHEEEIKVKYTNKNGSSPINVSAGCFCVSLSSKDGNKRAEPFSRRRRNISKKMLLI
jgi:hypothetical protein